MRTEKEIREEIGKLRKDKSSYVLHEFYGMAEKKDIEVDILKWVLEE